MKCNHDMATPQHSIPLIAVRLRSHSGYAKEQDQRQSLIDQIFNRLKRQLSQAMKIAYRHCDAGWQQRVFQLGQTS